MPADAIQADMIGVCTGGAQPGKPEYVFIHLVVDERLIYMRLPPKMAIVVSTTIDQCIERLGAQDGQG